MTIEFLDHCSDPAERAAREDVLKRFPMADPRIPMQVVDDLTFPERLMLDPATVIEQLGGGNG